jgi:hypothetical protein
MRRENSRTGFSIVQLERMLEGRKAELATLAREREKLARRLGHVDQRIHALGGGKGGPLSVHVRNFRSLMDMIEGVLAKAGKPMKVGDVVEAVLHGGYKTRSANFRGIVNQTLIKKNKFLSAGRGLYTVKKSTV